MSKAGKAGEGGVTTIGREHPLPENIPHLTSPGPNGVSNGSTTAANGVPVAGGTSGSPVKESSFLQRETSADDPAILSPKSPQAQSPGQAAISPPPQKEGVPIRWQS